ncbi:MAG: hypothetical protein A2075_16850 [Geobacteraceae bacterium GWC2_58_44]|nr:MAG: hypothetical protein A2075_16850 [Geobacteraceae bacterium GWC2_58_44]
MTTVAGNGTQGFSGDNSAATDASLNNPYGVAVDSEGNLYIAETGNYRIRKVTAGTGIITTVAGNGIQGDPGGTGVATATSLNNPRSVAVDSAGNLYIAEYTKHVVRKVAIETGIITTVAGSGAPGYSGDNGPATGASLDYPSGLAVDSAGNLYISDLENNRIRKVDAGTGIITTVAGNLARGYSGDNGPATGASLSYPSGVAVDSSGNLYISDSNNDRLRKVTAGTGIITTLAGNGKWGDNGLATAAALSSPRGVAVDQTGNLYIADSELDPAIRKVDAVTGIITTVAGNGTRGFSGDNVAATASGLNYPDGLAVDRAGNLYIADRSNHRIRKVDAGTGIITTVAGNGTSGFSGDNVAATEASLAYPHGVAVDSAGNLYIADTANYRIRKVTASSGIITTVAGNGTKQYSGDNGSATEASLSQPYGVAVDSGGNLYIADPTDNRIRKVTASTGVITTAAGNGRLSYSGDNGAAIAASLNRPWDIAVDSGGNLYIADYYNSRIRKVDAGTGIITTVAGSGSWGYSGDNIAATSASLYYAHNVAVDSAGNLYLADGNRIRKVIESIIPVVTASPSGGSYISARAVTLSANEPATTYYTTDGSDPTTSATRHSFSTTGQLTITASTTLKYYAVDPNGNASGAASQEYVIDTVTVPGAPTGVSGIAGNALATVSFTAPAADGGGSITSFTVTSDPGNLITAGTASPITVTGLTNGTAYTFTVKAFNSAGAGAASAPSASVTPIASYTLSLTLAGTGAGSVNGSMSCVSGTTCSSAEFMENTMVTLTATPDANSLTGGWSGACIATGNTCELSMESSKTVTATFNTAPRLRILGGASYRLFSAAYAEAADNAVIQARAILFENPELILGRNIRILFMGGYDAGFGLNSGRTAVKGRLLIRDGTVRVDRLMLR